MKALSVHQSDNKGSAVTDAMAVARRTALDPSQPCIPWTSTIVGEGYGQLVLAGRPHYAHRVAYQLHVGPINKGQEIDHVCHTANRDTCPGGPDCLHRSCIQPAHLELVSSRENSMRGNHPLYVVARKQECQRGHDLTNDANVYVRKDGRRRCRLCRREGLRGWRASKR